MRKFFLSAMAMIAMIGAMSLTSCSDEDNGDGGGGSGLGGDGVTLGGTVDGTLTLDASKEYHLTSALVVPKVPPSKYPQERQSRPQRASATTFS